VVIALVDAEQAPEWAQWVQWVALFKNYQCK